MEVATNPTLIDGKVLSTPQMQYGGSRLVSYPFKGEQMLFLTALQTPKFGAWNAVNQQFKIPMSVHCWAVVDYSPNSSSKSANQRFVSMIQDNCRKLGMRMLSVHCPDIS